MVFNWANFNGIAQFKHCVSNIQKYFCTNKTMKLFCQALKPSPRLKFIELCVLCVSGFSVERFSMFFISLFFSHPLCVTSATSSAQQKWIRRPKKYLLCTVWIERVKHIPMAANLSQNMQLRYNRNQAANIETITRYKASQHKVKATKKQQNIVDMTNRIQ